MKWHLFEISALLIGAYINCLTCFKALGNVNYYKNELGHCEPLTVDFIAGLFTKKARQLITPQVDLSNRHLRFDLYTRRNRYKKEMLRAGDKKLLFQSQFNAKWPVRISLHGWNGHTTTCSSAAIKDAYLDVGDFNVILVDWSDYSLDINYLQLISEVYEIAKLLNEFTRFLHTVMKVPFEDMYLIGHSYGCHIAGVAGKLLKPLRYGVIYALDTAGPIHQILTDEWRLAANDAIYVESIQTDTGLFGFRGSNVAHASFFPNWGLGQPHCPNITIMEPDFLCDHFSSLYYFVESIRNPMAFGAISCHSYDNIIQQKCGCGRQSKECPGQVFMGGEPAQPKRGVFYVSTNRKKPFGNGLMCRMRRAIEPTVVRINGRR